MELVLVHWYLIRIKSKLLRYLHRKAEQLYILKSFLIAYRYKEKKQLREFNQVLA
ncbi:hypothetical protein R615_03680 [Thalassolituus oleivorans R6-15]|nr:hypothetical protein R615_03680 [Thalassolituus oleivorans R6-15]